MENNISKKKLKILVSAGGTGGHLFPAIAVIDEIQNLLDNSWKIEIFSVGNPQKIEGKTSSEKGWNFTPIPMQGFSGFGLKFFKFFYNTIKSVNVIRELVRKENIDFGIGTGAYVTYPAGLGLHSERKPFFLLESNLVPGRANRLLAKKSSLFFVTYENTIKYLPPGVETKLKVYGTPIRKELLKQIAKEDARKKLGLDPHKPTLLVFGGSLGAKTINQTIYSNYYTLLEKGYQIVWQIGKNFPIEEPKNESIKIFEFIDDMATAYSSADIVVSRAGASTLAELTALGKPAILIPYPYAIANHQVLNAKELESNDAAIVIYDQEANEKLIPCILELFENPKRLETLSQNIRKFGKPDATKQIAKEILNFLGI